MLECKCFDRLLLLVQNLVNCSGGECNSGNLNFSTAQHIPDALILNLRTSHYSYIWSIIPITHMDEYCSYNEHHCGMQHN